MAVAGTRKSRRWSEERDHNHLLLLYNCYLKQDQVEASTSLVGQSVTHALGLEGSGWPRFLDDVRFISLREVGVPLKAGYISGERLPPVLLNVLVLCEGALWPEPHRSTLCCPERQSRSVRVGFRKSSVTHVGSELVESPFAAWSPNIVCSLGDLDGLGELSDRIRGAFASAAGAADHEVKDHIRKRNSTTHSSCLTGKAGKGQGKGGKGARAATNKDYERELGGSVETMRHLQRLKVGKSCNLNEITPLVQLPLQLGFCSAHEFENSNDDCKTGPTKKTSARFLELLL